MRGFQRVCQFWVCISSDILIMPLHCLKTHFQVLPCLWGATHRARLPVGSTLAASQGVWDPPPLWWIRCFLHTRMGMYCFVIICFDYCYVEIIICEVHWVTIVYIFWAIYLNCVACFWQCWDLSSCVLYQQRSASWCRTGWVFPAPESRSCCQSRPGRPKTWSGTPKPAGTGCKVGPEYSNRQEDNKNWNTREFQGAPTASSSLLLNMTCKFNFFSLQASSSPASNNENETEFTSLYAT